MGLLEQESGFRDDLVSSAGAKGRAQFTDATAELMARKYPTLRPPNPYSWDWSRKALGLLLAELRTSATGRGDSPCSEWLFMASMYNGGPTMFFRERDLCKMDESCNSRRWFTFVEEKRVRAVWAFKENRDYVWKVFLRGAKYAADGLGTSTCH